VNVHLRFTAVFACVAVFAACSGGGSSSPSPHVTSTPGGATPTPSGATPSPSPSGATPTPGPPASALPTAAYVFGSLALSSTFGEIDIFPKGSVGNASPTRLTSATLTVAGGSLTVDSTGTVYATGACPPCKYTLVEFAASVIGLNATPTRVINYPGGASPSPLIAPAGMVVDKSGYLYVLQGAFNIPNPIPAGIFIINPGASGSLSGQYSMIDGSATMLNDVNLSSLALDGSGNMYAAAEPSAAAPYIAVFAAGKYGNVAPIRVITGANTGLKAPGQIGVTPAGTLYVFDTLLQEVFVFAPNANGNVFPIAEIESPQLPSSSPMTVDTAGNVYAFNTNSLLSPQTLLVFDAGSSGFVSPSFTINLSASIGTPSGIAVAP